MIHSLKLRHWKSHETSRFEFSQGTNLLIGGMGAGKTSILDAICFALFGTFPALKSRRVTMDQVVMARPEQKREASVELAFQYNNQRYSVTRTLSGEGSEAYLRRGEQVIEGPQPIRTTEAIQNLLRLDYELFTRAIYAEQNRVDHVLTLTPRERKRQIDELLGLDAFENARATTTQVLNKLKAEREEADHVLNSLGYEQNRKLAQQLEQELTNLQQNKADAEENGQKVSQQEQKARLGLEHLQQQQTQYQNLDRKKTTAQAQVDQLHQQIEAEKNRLGELPTPEQVHVQQEAAAHQIEQLKNALQRAKSLLMEREKLRGQLEVIAREKKNRAQLEGLLYEEEVALLEKYEREREKLDGQVEGKRKETLSLQAQLASTQTQGQQLAAQARERASLTEQAKDLERKFGGDLESKLEKEREGIKERQVQLAQAQARAEETANAQQTLKKAGAGCPVCEAPLAEDRRKQLLEQKTHRHREYAEHHTTLQRQLQESSNALGELERAVSKWQTTQERLKALDGVEDNLQKARESERRFTQQMEQHQKQLQEGVEGAKAALDQENKQREQVHALGEMAGLLAQQVQLSDQLAGLEQRIVQQSADKLEAELASAQQQRKHTEEITRVYELVTRKGELETQLQQTHQALQELAFEPAHLEQARQQHEQLKQQTIEGKATIETLGARIEEKGARLKDVQGRLQEGQRAVDQRQQSEQHEQKMAVFAKALVETQTLMRAELMEGINETMELLWRSLYPYRDYTGVRLWGSEEDYRIEIKTLEGTWMPIEQASGGERSCAALSLRIAFAMVLAPQLSWLVLDEPTHNLDANAVLLLAHALRDEIPKIVDQVFIITHDEALKESASARTYRIERDKDKGDKSVIEEMAMVTEE